MPKSFYEMIESFYKQSESTKYRNMLHNNCDETSQWLKCDGCNKDDAYKFMFNYCRQFIRIFCRDAEDIKNSLTELKSCVYQKRNVQIIFDEINDSNITFEKLLDLQYKNQNLEIRRILYDVNIDFNLSIMDNTSFLYTPKGSSSHLEVYDEICTIDKINIFYTLWDIAKPL